MMSKSIGPRQVKEEERDKLFSSKVIDKLYKNETSSDEEDMKTSSSTGANKRKLTASCSTQDSYHTDWPVPLQKIQRVTTPSVKQEDIQTTIDKAIACASEREKKEKMETLVEKEKRIAKNKKRKLKKKRKKEKALGSRWIIELEGAQGTLYEEEKFQLQFKFGSRYPFDSPQVMFVGSNIPVHPHIYSNGHICLSILTEDWSPALSVESVCLSIVSMLSSCKEKKRPPDNNIYVSTCNKNPKKTRWWYHDDHV